MLYHKIQTIFKRDPTTNHKTLLMDEFSLPCFEYLYLNQWHWTEKVDGTNIRVIWKNGGISFGGRTENAQMPAPLVQRLNERFTTERFQSVFPDSDAILFGEGYGPKIQKGGGNYRKDQDFVLFDVFVSPRFSDWTGVYLERNNMIDVAGQFNLDFVPLIGKGSLAMMIEFVKNKPKSTWGDFTSEGVVARPSCELLDRFGNRIITKLKVRDFPNE